MNEQNTTDATTADNLSDNVAAPAQPVQAGTANPAPPDEGDQSALDGVPEQTDNTERDEDGEQDVSQDPNDVPEDSVEDDEVTDGD